MPSMMALLWGLATVEAAPPSWKQTVDRVADGVVSIRIDRTRAFDTTWYSTSQATGFVVDRERGLLLTNRHVVSPGPVRAVAVFSNNEEVPLRAVYRDPVHDFGVFAFDPEALRFAAPHEFELAPGEARVGTEVRVLGNDAGEKLSILPGTIARLDRPAPTYGSSTYNDFNTVYYQSASGTSGGSSGSPVIDRSGRVLAINAGGKTRAASSYFLPLERIERALNEIREGREPARGSLGITWQRKTFDELRRLGLLPATEEAARQWGAGNSGMLVIQRVLPGGPAADTLRVGDVLRSVGGMPIWQHQQLESMLDETVGGTITLEVERGGQVVQAELTIADLHAMTPARYVAFGGAVLHDLSYQQARNHNLPLAGVYVADAGYVLSRGGVPYRGVIHEVDGAPVSSLDALVASMNTWQPGQQVRLGWRALTRPQETNVAVIDVDYRWFPVETCERDEAYWPCEPVNVAEGQASLAPSNVTLPTHERRTAEHALASLVRVETGVPYTIEGVRGESYFGPGLVVDAEQGLVLTDRNTVPIALVDVSLVVAGSVEIPAEVAAVHPHHGLVLLKYDPALLGTTAMRSAMLDAEPIDVGDPVTYVGRDGDDRVVVLETSVARLVDADLPISSRPRFREANLALYEVSADTGSGGGVLVDKKGRVRSLFGSLSFDEGSKTRERDAGYPVRVIQDFIDAYRASESSPVVGGPEFEVVPIRLVKAVDLGLPTDVADAMAQTDERREALLVRRVTWGAPAADLLKTGDVLVRVNGEFVTHTDQLQGVFHPQQPVSIEVSRKGELVSVELTPRALGTSGLRDVVVWAGATLTDVPLEVAAQHGVAPEGVYVDLRFRGSPALRFGLGRSVLIYEVNGQPTPDLEAFMSVVDGLEDGASARLRTRSLNGREAVVALSLDLRDWPTRRIRWEDQRGWYRQRLD